jgi:Holliday junction DNA helicase RuvA
MISKLTGKLLKLRDEYATFEVPPFEYDVLIPEMTRRQLQMEVGNKMTLHTIHYLEGNPAQGGRLTPRLIGFTHSIEREFFDLFCSVDGVGVKKALRAMVRPVQEVAALIESQDTKALSGLPGIGPATADRVIAKLRRKMPKFALMVREVVGATSDTARDVIAETFEVLLSLGHNEADARNLVEQATSGNKKFKDVESLLQAVYQNRTQS